MSQRAAARMPSTMGGMTHVVFDPFMPERLQQLGATNVVCVCDTLVVGPSRGDGLAHARARKAWWGSPEQRDLISSPETQWVSPAVLWVSACLLDRISLFRMCHWLRQKGMTPRDIIIIELDEMPWKGSDPKPRFNCTDAASSYPDEVLRERLRTARAWSQARFDRAVKLWDAYVDEDPTRFIRSCARGVKGFPELGPLWAVISSFFPRKAAAGTLRLSRFDEIMFTILSREWQTPGSMIVRESKAGDDLRELIDCAGDLFLPHRLDEWVTYGSNPAVERAPGPRDETPMLAFAYRLSERGARRDERLESLADAPRMAVAGTEAYASPWVLCEDGKLARLSPT